MLDPAYDSYGGRRPVRRGASAAGHARAARRFASPRRAVASRDRAARPGCCCSILRTTRPAGCSIADELELIAAACREHDLICVTDEVYEHLVYDGEHVPIATLPGMAERTLTVSSVGKSFSFTGWKIGWCSGPAELVAAVRTVKQFLSFAGGTPLQHAAAAALRLGPEPLASLREDLRARRDQLCAGSARGGPGTDRSRRDATSSTPRWAGMRSAFCAALPERCGVVAIPTGAFYGGAGDRCAVWCVSRSASPSRSSPRRRGGWRG